MDEDYARRLRDWLRAEPEATPRRAAEEREWLREVPPPGPATDDTWAACQRRPAADEPNWLREVPAPEAPANDAWAACQRHSTPDEPNWLREVPPPEENWPIREQPPESPADDQVCPVIPLPVPRTSAENGCRMSEAEQRSRWNHPTNWHRRRREAEERSRRDQPGSR